MPIIIEGRKVWLRGAMQKEYKTLKSLEKLKEANASRHDKTNPKLAQAIRKRRMLTWLHETGSLLRSEKVEGKWK